MSDTAELAGEPSGNTVVERRYDPECNRSITNVIVKAIATAADTDPLDLPPLFNYVDPDAIDTLFAADGTSVATPMILTFRFGDWMVFIHSDGRIKICDPANSTDPEPNFQSDLRQDA